MRNSLMWSTLGLDLVGVPQGGVGASILVPADSKHRAEADECRTGQRCQPLANGEALAHFHISHVTIIPSAMRRGMYLAHTRIAGVEMPGRRHVTRTATRSIHC